MLGLGKHSIHTADTNEESNRLSELLFNRNSLERISCAWPREYPWLTDLTETYRAWLVATSTSSHTCCIAGSAVMAAWGLREARDLDFLSVTGKMTATGYKEIDEHNREHARWSDIEPERIVLDPRYHGYWRGLKMMSIQLVRANKKRRGEPKDVHDVGLIDRALTGQTKEPVGAWVRRTLRPGFVKGRVKFLLLRLRFYATRIRNSDRFG